MKFNPVEITQKQFYRILFLLTFIFTIIFIEIPFFWDYAKVSQAAHFFLDTKFTSLIIPEHLDPGHFPVVSLFFAASWKVFGQSLAVSHFVFMPFLLLFLQQFYLLSSRFLSHKVSMISTLALFIEPVLTTQTALMGYDVITAFLFVSAINMIYERKKTALLFILTAIALVSLRGIPAILSLFSFHLFLERKNGLRTFFKQNIFVYLVPTLLLISWLCFHYMKTEWIFTAPTWEEHRRLNSFTMVLRQSIYVFWKLADYGKIFFWIALVIFIIKNFKSNSRIYEILFLIVALVFFNAALIIPFSNPVGHKYFVSVYPLLSLVIIYIISKIRTRILMYASIAVFMIISITGSFIHYPERYGNGWDTSWKVFSYFNVKAQCDKFVKDNNISQKDVGASFPMFHNSRFTKLDSLNTEYTDFFNRQKDEFEYVLLSNISNNYSDSLKAEIRERWKLVARFESGLVYIEIFKNNNYISAKL